MTVKSNLATMALVVGAAFATPAASQTDDPSEIASGPSPHMGDVQAKVNRFRDLSREASIAKRQGNTVLACIKVRKASETLRDALVMLREAASRGPTAPHGVFVPRQALVDTTANNLRRWKEDIVPRVCTPGPAGQ